MDNDNEIKRCSKCSQYKTLDEFYKDKNHKDGLQYCCKICNQKHYKKYSQTISGHLRICWGNINRRCYDNQDKAYEQYGGRGIKNLFSSFFDFRDYITKDLDYDTYDKIAKLQIDRIDNDGNYEKGNIRFVTSKINNNNRRLQNIW